ncbi:hypothetical protein [Pseudacidovorax sp. RU35E]|uniref:hypothetical protein n=1 Tax=Pseudacidovorax sp. RU35E TaxID=1907403 RepID=UPI000953D64D|nr:hypothetical protein [Pseudacidovorax sp. RU35E]SIR46506.1 hypothetical protein SAMN05880557_111139 [Pseudacidovorax sp. RU35E]
MTTLSVRSPILAVALAAAGVLAGCATPAPAPRAPAPAPAPVATPPAPATRPAVQPVEVQPIAPATQMQPAGTANGYGNAASEALSRMLAYADRARSLQSGEAAAEIARIGDPGDSAPLQMQLALALAQTRNSADLARATALMQRVAGSTQAEAQPLQPLARVLASRYLEQRRVEDDRDRQVQQLKEAQRRIDHLNDRIEALRAIERSFGRPSGAARQSP